MNMKNRKNEYFKNLCSIDGLSKEEKEEFLKRAKKNKEITDAFLRAHFPFVECESKKFSKSGGEVGLSREEIVRIGIWQLYNAFEHFNLTKRTKRRYATFLNYAKKWIKNGILREIKKCKKHVSLKYETKERVEEKGSFLSKIIEEEEKTFARKIKKEFEKYGFSEEEDEVLLKTVFPKHYFFREYRENSGKIKVKSENLIIRNWSKHKIRETLKDLFTVSKEVKFYRLNQFLYRSPIDLIEIIPVFKSWFREIREKYKIKPRKIIFSPHYLFLENGGLREEFFRELLKKERDKKLHNEILQFLKNKTKLPQQFSFYLEAKIIFDENLGYVGDLIGYNIRVSHVFKNKSPITLKALKKDRELRKLKYLSPFDEVPYDGFLHQRYWWYLYRTQQKFNPKEADVIMRYMGFSRTNYEKNDKRMLKQYESIWLK